MKPARILLPSLLASLLSSLLALSAVLGCSKADSDSSKPSSSASKADAKSPDKQDPNTIRLTAEQQRLGNIATIVVEPREVPRTLEAPAQVMMDEDRTTHLSTISSGRVTDVLARAGDTVKRGQVLALVHSHEVHETIGTLEQAIADVDRRRPAVTFAAERADRYTHLYSIQAASREESERAAQDLLQAKNDLALAEVSVHTESEHLADLFQIPASSLDIHNLAAREGAREEVPIRAAAPGVVITRTVTPGMVLDPGMEAFTVSDLGTVWVIAAVSETDLRLIHRGDAVRVRTDAWPGEIFAGRITLIGSTLDPATRTLQVRITVTNPLGRLKPQMFASVEIAGSAARQALFVPESSLVDVNGVSVVFTRNGTVFRPHPVKTAKPVNGEVEVLDGLQAGREVVTSGAFTLKSELLKGTIGED